MPTVNELTAPYGNFMLGPQPGPGVCDTCFDLIDEVHTRCHRCATNRDWLDAMAPIAYSVAYEQLHHALRAYKRLPDRVARRFQIELAAVLWRYLADHEHCLATAAGVDHFDLVTAVPSSSREREQQHPLTRMLATLITPARERYEALLARSREGVSPRQFSLAKFSPIRELDGQSVLLIDDTWTTGASARSAAASLKVAGAGAVAALVIGRHLHRDWGQNDRRLRELTRPFDWRHCAQHAYPTAGACGETGEPGR
jgi:predicted amidophosphoribosyltransferase